MGIIKINNNQTLRVKTWAEIHSKATKNNHRFTAINDCVKKK